MEIPIPFRRNPHESLEKNPKLVRTEKFWDRIKPTEFLEANPRSALNAVREAILAGVTHPNVRITLKHALRAGDADSIIKYMGAHQDGQLAKAVISQLGGDVEIKDASTIKALWDHANTSKELEKILTVARDEDIVAKLLQAKKKDILQDNTKLKTVVQNDLALKKMLEMEWHSEMTQEQLNIVNKTLREMKGTSPRKNAEILANTLIKDVRSKKAAEATAILLRGFLNAISRSDEETLIYLYNKIKQHAFSNKEFGKALLHIAGEDMARALITAADNKQNRREYEKAKALLGEAIWLLKETIKNNTPDRLLWAHQRIGERTRPEDYIKTRANAILSTLTYFIKKSKWQHHYDIFDDVVEQIAKSIEYLGRNEINKYADHTHIRNVAQALTRVEDDRIIHAIANVAMNNPEFGKLLLNAYLSSVPDEIAHQRVGKIIRYVKQKSTDAENHIVKLIKMQNKIPDPLRRIGG